MSCARPRCPQAQPHRSSSFHHLPCCLSSSFSEQYGVQRNRGQLRGSRSGLSSSRMCTLSLPSMIRSSYQLCETRFRVISQPLAAAVGSSAGRSPCGRQLWLGGPRGAIVMPQDRTPHQRHIAPKNPRHLSLKVTIQASEIAVAELRTFATAAGYPGSSVAGQLKGFEILSLKYLPWRL